MKLPIFHQLFAFAVFTASTLSVFAADETKSKASAAVDGTTATGAAASVQPVPANSENGIYRSAGQHWLVDNGWRTKIGPEHKLPEGMMIHADGKVMVKGGKAVELKDGQFITNTGDVKEVSAAMKKDLAAEDKTPGSGPAANVAKPYPAPAKENATGGASATGTAAQSAETK